jgi:hypothetical protein
MGKWNNYIQVKEVKGHMCTLDRIDTRHQNISADFVASHMYPHIVNSLEYAPKAIIGATEEKFGYTISYGKAYLSHPILQGKPNASHVCARINLHTHDRQKSVIPLQ